MALSRASRWSILGVAVVLLAAAGFVGFLRWAHGFSARDEPPGWEKTLARAARGFAHPRAVRALANPVRLTPQVSAEARAHFADHCAVCHGNDGRGQTEIGRNLYPRAPDMTAEDTQSMTDGELFHAIKNGVRLTGMPAWGVDTPEADAETWQLVHFIRHLPRITPEELAEMTEMNPKGRQVREQEEAERRFLEGGEVAPAPPSLHSEH